MAAILRNRDGTLLTRDSGVFELFDIAFKHAEKLLECCTLEPALKTNRHRSTLAVVQEHFRGIQNNYLAFEQALAIPQGNLRRAVYRFDKLVIGAARLSEAVSKKNTKNAQTIVAENAALQQARTLIKAAVTLLK